MIFPGIKIPWRVFACAGVLVVLGFSYWYVYDLGQDHNEAKHEKQLKEAQKLITELQGKQGSITVSGEIRYVEKVKVIKEKSDVIIKKVTEYIPVDSPDLPPGFRVLHDSAALGTVPGAAEDGSSVPVRTAAETIARNYAICHQWKAALGEQLQWGKQQRELYLSECKRLGQSCN